MQIPDKNNIADKESQVGKYDMALKFNKSVFHWISLVIKPVEGDLFCIVVKHSCPTKVI